MIIEKLRIDDYDEIHQIWSNTNGITLRAIDDSKEGIERFLIRNPNINFICRINGNIVGGILCGHDGRKGFIYHVVVKENYRERGIGKKLVEHVIKSLIEEKITKISVLVNSDNISGIDFWESLGFEYFNDLKYRILPLDELNT
ncbi:MAG: GNAT family N-acetyltransferase [Thermodesulfobacteriota bacterium]|nr:GNAT family N-acetyltransferase [Thermodesulfobacteriota bacterium]